MKNVFNVTTVLPHNLLQTNPCIRHNFSTQVFRKCAAQLHFVGPELRYIFWAFLTSLGSKFLERLESWHSSNIESYNDKEISSRLSRGYAFQLLSCLAVT